MNGLMTEREWRRQAARAKPPRPVCWGAQCVLPAQKRKKLRDDRSFSVFLLLLSLSAALAIPMLTPRTVRQEYPQATAAQSTEGVQARAVSAVSYELPVGMETQTVTYTYEQLLRGGLMLLDGEHPLPGGAPAPNTMSVAAYGKGMVPVNGLSVKSGRDTIEALAKLFAGLRAEGVSGLCVWSGTLTRSEQAAAQAQAALRHASEMPLEDAVRKALAQDTPVSAAEQRRDDTVEIRLIAGGSKDPDPRPLDDTEEGRALIRLAWRSGFIRREPEGEGASAFRFRYVGKAHATAMTYLDLRLEEYLEWLHQKGVLAVQEDGRLKYLILCKPLTGTHIAFDVPAGASVEASFDNDGYAVVACTLQEN